MLCYTARVNSTVRSAKVAIVSMSKRNTGLSIIIVSIVAFVAYLPALKIQFYDGWWYMMWVATMDLPRYLIQFFDPANITQGYRPVQGLYMYLLYHLFGFNPDGYHLAHNLLHAANSVLLFLLVARLSKLWRFALVAALIYSVLPNYSLAIFWHAVVDPLSGFFYLLTLFLWTRFLETRRMRDYAVTFGVFVLALLSKEIAVFLPLFMFLIEWWFYGNTPNWRVDIPRYSPFIAAFFPYLWQVYQVQSHGEFVGQFGFRIGPHMLSNLIPYMAVLAFPWTADFPADPIFDIWLAIVVVLYVGITVYKRSAELVFLALFAILNIAPLLGFPLDYFNTRYLYLSTVVSAILLALVFEAAWRWIGARRVSASAVAVLVALTVLAGGVRVADAAAGLAEYTRQIRVPFRDISRQHPTFPPDTYLYFVYSPLTTYWDFEGLFFSRYGRSVKLNGTDLGQPANLRNHTTAYVYYFDPTGKPIELPVDKDITTRITPGLPAQLEIPMILEHFEVPTARLERGKALVVILNWRATAKLEKDYTVFAHLVDPGGNRIAEYDSQPGKGKSPTTQWTPNRAFVDAAVLPISVDAPIGENYRLEVGMYDLETMQRFAIVDASGNRIGDRIIIEPFSIVSK